MFHTQQQIDEREFAVRNKQSDYVTQRQRQIVQQ